MFCPVCGSHNTGLIGRERYYCEQCCHEWLEKDGKITVFKIKQDGQLCRLRLNIFREREAIGDGLF